MPVEQNPLFAVSTDYVEATMTDNGIILGANVVIEGGSGSYIYLWTDENSTELGTESTLNVTDSGIYYLKISDTCDCQLTVEFNIKPAGIDSIESDAIKCYVENKTLYVENSSQVKQLTLVSIDGIMSAVYNYPNPQIDVNTLNTGVYIANMLTVNDDMITSKIVIK